MARDAAVAVILRRGPTKQVRLLRWDLRSDEIMGGQWLAGRVYEERCGLSPDGELLVYFAMRKGHTWTAVSRPPWFTPLLVWEESGTWGGGGAFVSERRLLLRTNPAGLVLDEKFELPKGFELGWLGEADREAFAGGWEHRPPDGDDVTTPSGKPRPSGPWAPPIRSRPRPADPSLVLEAHPVVVEDPYGPFAACEWWLRDGKRDRAQPLPGLDWADWDPAGDLLYARDGELVRATILRGGIDETKVLRRMSEDRFAAVPPPPEATQWPAMVLGRSKRAMKRRSGR